MDIKKILSKVVQQNAEQFDSYFLLQNKIPPPTLRGSESEKVLPEGKPPTQAQFQESKINDAQIGEKQGTDAVKCHAEKPRRLEIPPNCYDAKGMIQAYCAEYSYKQVYNWTSKKLVIKKDGERRIPCAKCITKIEYDKGIIGKENKKLACSYCRKNGGLRYLDWCNTCVENVRNALYPKGLVEFADRYLGLGFDIEKQALIFPLNHYQYVELGFDGRKFTQSKTESLPTLMHFNRTLYQDIKDGLFKPIFNPIKDKFMPYLDNRFYGVDGEIVIAGCAAFPDNGKKAISEGKIVLPFPLK